MEYTRIINISKMASKLFINQIIVFLCMYIGYLLYMVVRKSFAFSMTAILDEGDMGKMEVGKVCIVFALCDTGRH